MCTVYDIDTILDTDLLLTKNKFNRMTLTKKNDNLALGRMNKTGQILCCRFSLCTDDNMSPIHNINSLFETKMKDRKLASTELSGYINIK